MQLRDYCRDNYGHDFDNLPKTNADAIAIGSRYFFNGKPCPKGHVEARYAKGGRCVLCTRMDSAKARGADPEKAGSQVRANIARAKSIKAGDTTYVPSKPCRYGHYLRYTASANCVQCDIDTRERQKEMRREARLKKVYGLTFKCVDKILRDQGGKCAICLDDICRKTLHIDHCHSGGHVRGLLCQKCNQGLGLFRDNSEFLTRAAEYIDGN